MINQIFSNNKKTEPSKRFGQEPIVIICRRDDISRLVNSLSEVSLAKVVIFADADLDISKLRKMALKLKPGIYSLFGAKGIENPVRVNANKVSLKQSATGSRVDNNESFGTPWMDFIAVITIIIGVGLIVFGFVSLLLNPASYLILIVIPILMGSLCTLWGAWQLQRENKSMGFYLFK